MRRGGLLIGIAVGLVSGTATSKPHILVTASFAGQTPLIQWIKQKQNNFNPGVAEAFVAEKAAAAFRDKLVMYEFFTNLAQAQGAAQIVMVKVVKGGVGKADWPKEDVKIAVCVAKLSNGNVACSLKPVTLSLKAIDRTDDAPPPSFIEAPINHWLAEQQDKIHAFLRVPISGTVTVDKKARVVTDVSSEGIDVGDYFIVSSGNGGWKFQSCVESGEPVSGPLRLALLPRWCDTPSDNLPSQLTPNKPIQLRLFYMGTDPDTKDWW